jgi:hypothetical protein
VSVSEEAQSSKPKVQSSKPKAQSSKLKVLKSAQNHFNYPLQGCFFKRFQNITLRL